MRIGIVTWYGSGNYGTNLQCYAFCHYLQNQGHTPLLIRAFKYDRVGAKYTLRRFLGNIKHTLINSVKHQKPSSAIVEYKRRYLNIYPLVTTKKDYLQLLNSFDCFFSGSDQIWNPYYILPFYLLDFANSKPRFAYASSLGVTEIPEEMQLQYKNNLQKFSHIGIREKIGKDTVNKLLGKDKAVQVLDPTFLLSKAEWHIFSEYININGIPLMSYMFVYVIGKREVYTEYIKQIQKHYGIPHIVCVESTEGGYYNAANLRLNKISPMQFIFLLMNARMVCTDSFHATALSINMNLNFIELLRFEDTDMYSQNSRIYDLLDHYSLSDRLYKGQDLPDEGIDYELANTVLARDREYSVNFIDDCLKSV